MSKFLEAVENNIPEKDLDKITDAKRALQRFLLSKDINVKVKTFRDDIMIELEDGRMVKLEVQDITDNVEDNQGKLSMSDAIGAVAGIPDQGLKKNLMSPTARALTGAKKNMAKAAKNISKKMLDASKTI
tara:strand:+ start:106 stop:495 length:390 start_codon:yes stop_codon:yes gene_type:complete